MISTNDAILTNDAMNDKLDINLRVADTALSLNINRDEEALLRKAAKEINYAWNAWRMDARFSRKTPHEVLAMVTLLFAKGYLSRQTEVDRLDEILASFEDSLDQMLGIKDYNP